LIELGFNKGMADVANAKPYKVLGVVILPTMQGRAGNKINPPGS